MRLHNSGVMVYSSGRNPMGDLIALLAAGALTEIKISEFGELGKKKN